MVAPHTGAWIETSRVDSPMQVRQSHPTRVRGLKPNYAAFTALTMVAPHTGAWIETSSLQYVLRVSGVAPHTGAWIETNANEYKTIPICRTPHGCVD